MARKGFLLAAALVILALVLFGRIPGDSRLAAALQNAAHAPAFFALSLIVLTIVRRLRRPVVLTFVLCFLIGAGIEILQAQIGGDGELADVLTDIVGIAAGLSGAAWLRSPSLGRALAFLAAVGVAAAPAAWACAAYLHRSAEFPTIAAFDSSLERYFFKPQSAVSELMPEGGLRVRLAKGPWPGISLEEPEPDWSRFRMLVVYFVNPEGAALPLTIRVHDRAHNQEADDRYNFDFVLPPHAPYRLNIALADVRSAPRNRQLDLSEVAGLIIFAKPQSAGREFLLERIQLE